MQRIFIYEVPELKFDKKDLNLPKSENRHYIGQLSLLVTNTIFLSHKLRKNVTIRFFVKNPIKHVIEIRSDTIRYLGPEERSLASIIRKTELYLSDLLDKSSSLLKTSHEPNPGIKLLITEDVFQGLEKIESSIIFQILDLKTLNNFDNDFYELLKFEKSLMDCLKKKETLIFYCNLTKNNVQEHLFENQKEVINMSLQRNNLSKSIGIINIILDKINDENQSS